MMFLGHNNRASSVSWSTILAVLLLPAAVFGQQQDVDVASQMEALAASFEGAFIPRQFNWLAALSGVDDANDANGLPAHDAIADMLKEHDNEIRVDDANADADMKIEPMTAEALGDIRKGLGVVLEHWDGVYGAFRSSIAHKDGPSRNRDLQSLQDDIGASISISLAAIGPGIGQGQVPGTNPTSSSEDNLISAIFGVLGGIFGEDSDILVLAFIVILVLLALFSPEGEASRQAEMSIMHDVAMTPMKSAIVGALEGTNMTMTMDSPEVNNIADALLGKAENLLNKIITEFKKLTSSDGRRLQAGLNPVAILLGVLDEFLLFLPEAIEGLLSENELTILCLVYDSLSYTATSMFRILIQILDELWRVQFLGEMPRPNDILQIDSYAYFASLPGRFRLCGVEIVLSGSGGSINQEEFAICIASSFLPFVPILFRSYFASIPRGTLPSLPGANLDFIASFSGLSAPPTLGAGRAVMSLDYLLEENPYDSNNVVNIFGFTNDNVLADPDFYQFSSSDFQVAFEPFEDGIQRLLSYENNLVDKSFASIRVTTGVDICENDCDGKCNFPDVSDQSRRSKTSGGSKKSGSGSVKISGGSRSKSASGIGENIGDFLDEILGGGSKSKSGRSGKSRMSKSLRSGKSKKDTCENEFEAFVSGGVKNSFTCDAITEDSLNFLGSNAKIQTQIILDRFECDEKIREHLFERYCDPSNNFRYDGIGTGNEDFLTKTDGCSRDNICDPMSVCTISDLPILRSMFAPAGNLPKFIKTRPSNDDIRNDDITEASLATVTAIPSIFALRHFASNQLPTVDLVVHAFLTHLVGPQGDARASIALPPPTIPSLLWEVLAELPGIGPIIGDIIAGTTGGQDDLIHALIRQHFLNDDPCGPSLPLAARKPLRTLFGLDINCATDPFPVPFPARTPVGDYASVFAAVPLLADVGNPIDPNVISAETLGNVAPYNSDHDLITLSISEYFGTDVTIDGHFYTNILDYIQQTIMDPLDIDEKHWFNPGSLDPFESPVFNNDAVALTVEPMLFDVRDLRDFFLEELLDEESPIGNPYARFLSGIQASVEFYYRPGAPSPWLGQGSGFMASGAWTKLYEDHYIRAGTAAISPQGYRFRDGSEFVFKVIGGLPRENWSTLGEPWSTPEGCTAIGWGAYSGGAIGLQDCPQTDCEASGSDDGGDRDITTIYRSNQQDVFTFSFKSFQLSFPLQMFLIYNLLFTPFINSTPNPLYAFGQYLFGNQTPYIATPVVQTCTSSGFAVPSVDTCTLLNATCAARGAPPTGGGTCSNPLIGSVIDGILTAFGLKGSFPFDQFQIWYTSINCCDCDCAYYHS